MRVWRSLSLGLVAVFAAAGALAQDAASTSWYTIVTDDGTALGHASTEIATRGAGREVIDTQEIYLREQGSLPTRVVAQSTRRENAGGRTEFIRETTRNGRFVSTTEARIGADAAHISRETPAGRWNGTVALPPDIRFDDGEGLLATWDASAPLAFDNFNLGAEAAERIIIEAAGPRDAEGNLVALRRRYENGQLRGIARLSIDRAGRLLDTAQPMFGATIHIRSADRATAEEAHAPYAVVPNSMVRSPYRISTAATEGHIRYRFSYRDGLTFALPQTGEQRASIDGNLVTLDICSGCGPGLATDEASLRDALRATSWMQIDDPRLRALAAPIARANISGVHKMELLLERARPYLARVDFQGHYSALDTLERRAGDCTEAAVLLTALARAAGIPARVVSGLAYSRDSYHGVSNAFMPHSWTLAYVDGQWRSFDLALEKFDSTHIAVTVGDGDARSIAAASQLASLLSFDGMAEVRPRS